MLCVCVKSFSIENRNNCMLHLGIILVAVYFVWFHRTMKFTKCENLHHQLAQIHQNLKIASDNAKVTVFRVLFKLEFYNNNLANISGWKHLMIDALSKCLFINASDITFPLHRYYISNVYFVWPKYFKYFRINRNLLVGFREFSIESSVVIFVSKK